MRYIYQALTDRECLNTHTHTKHCACHWFFCANINVRWIHILTMKQLYRHSIIFIWFSTMLKNDFNLKILRESYCSSAYKFTHTEIKISLPSGQKKVINKSGIYFIWILGYKRYFKIDYKNVYFHFISNSWAMCVGFTTLSRKELHLLKLN